MKSFLHKVKNSDTTGQSEVDPLQAWSLSCNTVSKIALSSSHRRASSSSTLCLPHSARYRKCKELFFQNAVFPQGNLPSCFHGLSSSLRHKHVITRQLMIATGACHQVSIMHLKFHSSSPVTKYQSCTWNPIPLPPATYTNIHWPYTPP